MDRICEDPGFGKASQCRSSEDPLLWAVLNENWALAEYLLAACSDGDIFTVPEDPKDGRNMFVIAANNCKTTLFQQLLSVMTDDDKRRAQVELALRDAQNEKALRILLEAGADIHMQSGINGTALYNASWKGHEEVVQILLDLGADVNAQGGLGSPLQAASVWGRDKVVKMLLHAGADVNAQGGDQNNALQAASHKGHQTIVQTLLDAGADVNTMVGDSEIPTALHAAIFGAVLHDAISRKQTEVIQMLLSAGAKVNNQGRCHETPLRAASLRGQEEAVKMLLAAGARVNAQGDEYVNALQAASSRGHAKIVQILLDADAEKIDKSDHPGNALQVEISGRYDEVTPWDAGLSLV